jgi:hypothetical protein
MASPATRTKILRGVYNVLNDSLPAFEEIKQVYLRLRDDSHATEQFPCLEVRRSSKPDEERGGTAEEYEVGYAVDVVYKYRSEAGPNAPDERADRWYEKLGDLFRQRNPSAPRLPGLPGCREVKISPLSVLEVQEGTFQLVTGGMTILVYVFEARE